MIQKEILNHAIVYVDKQIRNGVEDAQGVIKIPELFIFPSPKGLKLLTVPKENSDAQTLALLKSELAALKIEKYYAVYVANSITSAIAAKSIASSVKPSMTKRSFLSAMNSLKSSLDVSSDASIAKSVVVVSCIDKKNGIEMAYAEVEWDGQTVDFYEWVVVKEAGIVGARFSVWGKFVEVAEYG